MANARTCLVSFTDAQGMEHTVEVAAETLFEAAALGVQEFRRGLMEPAGVPGPAARLRVTVKSPSTTHQLTMSRLEAWLSTNGRSPKEHSLKARLRAMLNGG